MPDLGRFSGFASVNASHEAKRECRLLRRISVALAVLRVQRYEEKLNYERKLKKNCKKICVFQE